MDYIDKFQYRERSDSLISLGFIDYKSYLKSDLWKSIRLSVLKDNNYKCKYCKEKAFLVHHSSYDLQTMAGNNKAYLYAVCNKCHASGHWTGRAESPDFAKRESRWEYKKHLWKEKKYKQECKLPKWDN